MMPSLYLYKWISFIQRIVKKNLPKARARIIETTGIQMPDLESLRFKYFRFAHEERGDVPGWVLVVLMTTGLVTGIWTVAQPRLSSILRTSLDNMNSIR